MRIRLPARKLEIRPFPTETQRTADGEWQIPPSPLGSEGNEKKKNSLCASVVNQFPALSILDKQPVFVSTR